MRVSCMHSIYQQNTQTINHLIITMEVFHNAPDSATFVSLAEHQSHTPASFYNGPPVLHHRTNGCKIIVSAADLHASPALSALQSAPGANGVDSDADVEITDIDVWVTSEYVCAYNVSNPA